MFELYSTIPSLDKSPGDRLNRMARPGNSPISVPVDAVLPAIVTGWFFCRRPIQITRPELGAAATRTAAGRAALCAGVAAGCRGGGAAGFSGGGSVSIADVVTSELGVTRAVCAGGITGGAGVSSITGLRAGRAAGGWNF